MEQLGRESNNGNNKQINSVLMISLITIQYTRTYARGYAVSCFVVFILHIGESRAVIFISAAAPVK